MSAWEATSYVHFMLSVSTGPPGASEHSRSDISHAALVLVGPAPGKLGRSSRLLIRTAACHKEAHG